MKTRISNYLHFTRAERNGTIVLFLLAAALFIFPALARQFNPPDTADFTAFDNAVSAFKAKIPRPLPDSLFPFNPNTASAAELERLGLPPKIAGSICRYREKGGSFRNKEDFGKIWGLRPEDLERLGPWLRFGLDESATAATANGATGATIQLAPFDPNTADEAALRSLGLPERCVKSILNYREKGGRFRNNNDLAKIYTLSEADFARIAPYAQYEASAFVSTRPAKAPPQAVDINQADLEQWKTLPGIGEARAQQLLRFRDKLGGFLSVAQVAEMYGLPDSVFQQIRPFLTLDERNIRKINLNTATEADLDAHPYISTKQASLIVNYRQQHGAYAAVDDLQQIRAFSDKNWLEKVRPYLAVQ